VTVHASTVPPSQAQPGTGRHGLRAVKDSLAGKVVLVSGGTQGLGADITDVTQAAAAVATTVSRHGRIDSLVNAARLTPRGTLLDTTEELFDQHVAFGLSDRSGVVTGSVIDWDQIVIGGLGD
jgi:hypothetical protein